MIFFFFQAEDGIRDLTVTGVQTCALPISVDQVGVGDEGLAEGHDIGVAVFHGAQRHVAVIAVVDHPGALAAGLAVGGFEGRVVEGDRKSTRLNSSHSQISYAVFCLKKKKKKKKQNTRK